MKWEAQGTSYPVDFFGSFTPEDVLYDFDGPRIFTVHSRHGDMLLVYQCDEDDTMSRFVVVPCDEAIVDALRTGHRSVRSALTQPWTWVVDQRHGQPIHSAWRAQLTSVPKGLLPDGWVMLHPAVALLPSVGNVGADLPPIQKVLPSPAPAARRRGAQSPFPAFATVEARP